MGYAYILDLLRTNNPFASDSVADPWEDIYPSVAAIHARPFQELSGLVSQKANNPSLATGALILGEPGSGKTHLVKRIVETVHTARRPLLVAYIQPTETAIFPFSYLLKEIIGNLRRPIRGHSTTQLDRLLSRWLLEQLGSQIKDLSPAMAAAVQNQPERILSLNLSSLGINAPLLSQDLPRPLRKILPFYQQKEHRQVVIDWLAGEVLDTEVVESMKLPDRHVSSAEERESEALELLVALGELLTRYNYCLLVCFDRWENLDTIPQLTATGRMVGELFDRIRGMLPVVLARRLDWEERFSQSLNEHVVSRLANNRFSLGNCNRENAVALIKSRLAFVLGEAASGIEPFTQEQLDHFLGIGSMSPRSIISLANEQLRNLLHSEPSTKAPSISEVLTSEFQNRHRQILADSGQDAPDRGRLLRALHVLLRRVPGVILKEPSIATKDKIDLLLDVKYPTGQHREIALIIDLEQHHRAVGAAIERGLNHLNEGVGHQVVYVRDGRHPIPERPKWPATNDRREKLEQQGALLWTLNTEQAAGWYALADLAYAVRAGDVTLAHGGRLRILSAEELDSWAAEELRMHTVFATLWQFLQQLENDHTEELSTESKLSPTSASTILDICTALLKSEPTGGMIALQILEKHLTQQGQIITQPILVELLNNSKDRFTLIANRGETVVMLNTEGVNPSSLSIENAI